MKPRSGFLLAAVCLLAACAGKPSEPTLYLERTDFASIDGWALDQPYDALYAFRKSCDALIKLPSTKTVGSGVLAAPASVWQEVCAPAVTATDARAFFETRFTPFHAHAEQDRELSNPQYTGYYEPELRGSLIYGAPYTTPLYPVPPDLQARKANGGYFTREQIDRGALAGLTPLVYVDDPVDAFFLEIQGSGVVMLAGGGELRLGFAAQNGHPYMAIGKVLKERGLLDGKVTAPLIKDWLRSHPEQMREILWENPSYVFFKKRDTATPVGAQGVELTPGRSIAVDRRFLPLGMPVWVSVVAPTLQGVVPWRRLTVAQDTGGAIKGPVRADVFFGRGMDAEYSAGNLSARGEMVLLLPHALAGRVGK